MKNKIDRENLMNELKKETYGLKYHESAYFIGALMSNLAHNLPAELADQIIDSFKESRKTVREIVKSFKESE